MRRPGGVITGTVVDSLTGLALHRVAVMVAGPSNFARQRVTDVSGRFRFDSLRERRLMCNRSAMTVRARAFSATQDASIAVVITPATRFHSAASLWNCFRPVAVSS